MPTARRRCIFLAPLLAVAAGCGPGPSTGPSPAPAAAPPAAHTNMADMPAHAVHAEKSPQAPASAHQIVIDNFAFAPVELTVPVGAEVTWVNRDDVPHTATSTAKPKAFDSGALDTDQTYSHVFKTSGEYEYFSPFIR